MIANSNFEDFVFADNFAPHKKARRRRKCFGRRVAKENAGTKTPM